MVKGLDLFRDHFKELADRYVLIGGTACHVIMNEKGLQFRATKDLDIVLHIESLDAKFAQKFWRFIKEGGYQIRETAEGKRRFYRFQKPANEAYPTMLELFSRAPDALNVAEGSHLVPIPINDEVSSLSAILLDKDYYDWIQAGMRLVGDLPVVGPEYLVPLKAKAWLDLRARQQAGKEIDRHSIQKHKNDVFRLFQVIDPEADVKPPPSIRADVGSFLDQLATENVDLKALGLRTVSRETVIDGFRKLYGIASGS